MQSKIIRIGNSIGITLPKSLCNFFKIEVGDNFNLSYTDGKWILERTLDSAY